MMRTRFRRRRRAAWQFSDATLLNLNGQSPGLPVGSPAQWFQWLWLLPPARAQFLMRARNRNMLTFAGAHLWFDFYWSHTGAANVRMPDADFCIYKSTIVDPTSLAPDLTTAVGQWDQPSTPSNITSWDEDDDDGLAPFLWQHHIKGFTPPNAAVAQYSSGPPSAAGNQTNFFAAGAIDNPLYVCRKFNVTQEWQPDVVVRSKRRLKENEGIVLVMSAVGLTAGQVTPNMHLDCRLRTLVS